MGCRLERSRQWAVRCVHEAQLHSESCFVTLTYRDECLPPDLSLRYRDFQLFMKRLRRECKVPLRYFAAGEYGEVGSRPHYHACLFGVGFRDRVYWRRGDAGFNLYRSALLERVWGLGHCEIGDLSFQSAAYVARYVVKKELGVKAGPRRCLLDVTTGEMIERDHEFAHMSLRPGIGAGWLTRFFADVYPAGSVVVDGVQMKAPRYYDKLLKRRDPALMERVAFQRGELAKSRGDDSRERLAVKEQVLKARISFLKRS